MRFLREHPRCCLFSGMGTGKTTSAILVDDTLRVTDVITDPTLVVGPMRVAKDTWPDEQAKWENFSHLRVRWIGGTPAVRAALLRKRPRADIYTISYELVPWLVEHLLEQWPFRQVIADESDRLKGFRMQQGGERAGQLGRVAHTLVDRWINLTGTPSPNGLKDLWGQMWYIDRGERLGSTYTKFLERWFYRDWNGVVKPIPGAQEQIQAAIRDVCLTIDAKDYYDLHEPIVTRIPVKLPPAARKIYTKLEKELFVELENGAEIQVFNSAALTNKCLQLANGQVYTDHPNWTAVHDEKIEALKSVEAEAGGMPLLVAYEFQSDLARLRKAFPKAVLLSDSAGMAAFRGGTAPIGLAHPKSMGHGIDGLQTVTNILVRYGHNWDLGQRLQMLERIGPMRQLQAGLDREVRVYDLVAEDTLDDVVLERHESKRGVQNLLLEAMKRAN
jgi:hypothetical protein